MSEMRAFARSFVNEDDGATLLEYGMLVLLITLLAIVFVTAIGKKVSAGFSRADSLLP